MQQKYPELIGEDPFDEMDPFKGADFDMVEAAEKGDPGFIERLGSHAGAGSAGSSS